MRRTVWGILLVLLVLAVVMQAVTVVERRASVDDWETHVGADGRVVKVRGLTLPQRFAIAETTAGVAARKSSSPASSSRKAAKPASEDREAVWWTGSVKSRPHAKTDIDAAYNEALDRAGELLVREFRLPTRPSRDFIRTYVEKSYIPAEGPHDDGTIGETQIVQLDLELKSDSWKQLALVERQSRINERLETLIRLSVIATALLACVAGYIRLDEYTKGYYTGRLRFAALAMIAVAMFSATR